MFNDLLLLSFLLLLLLPLLRVFTFGIGSGASTALVNGLAQAGRGSAEFVKEGERMQPKVRAGYVLIDIGNVKTLYGKTSWSILIVSILYDLLITCIYI